MINNNELMYKLNEVIEYLKNNSGYDYKVYNHLCPNFNNEPDSNIVEYEEDVKQIIEKILEKSDKNFM